MKILTSGFIMLFGICTNVFAGNEHGNGGNSIVCSSGKPEAMELYEARVGMRGFDIDLGPPSLPVEDKIAFVLKRIAALDPSRYELWSNKVQEFFTNANFWNGPLPVLADYGDIILEPGCQIEQTIVQKISPFPEERIYRISQSIWNALDNDSRATLVLHEVIWGEAFNVLLQSNSKKSRYYIEYLLDRRKVTEMKVQQYTDLLKFVDFKYFSYLGASLSLASMRLGGSGAPLSGSMYEGSSVKIGKNLVKIEKGSTIVYGWEGTAVSDITTQIIGLSAISAANLVIGDQSFPKAYGEISFYQNGNVRWIRTLNDIEHFPFKFLDNRTATFQNNGYSPPNYSYSPGFGFSESGQLRCGALASPVELVTGESPGNTYNIQMFPEGACVRFDAAGFAAYCSATCQDF